MLIDGRGRTASDRPACRKPGGVNCYNRITVKWHPAAGQTCIRIVIAAVTHQPKTNKELLRKKWYWKTLWEDDLSFVRNGAIVQPKKRAQLHQPFAVSNRKAQEKFRKRVRQDLAELRL